MALFQKPQPASAVSDVIKAIRTPVPHKIGIAGVCAALTYLMVTLLIHDFSPQPVYRHPTIIYVKQWPKNRTLAQMKRQEKVDAATAAAQAKEDAVVLDVRKAAQTKRQAEFEHVHQTLKSYGIN